LSGSCGPSPQPRQYYIHDTAGNTYNNGILTMSEPHRRLTVTTTDPTRVGTWSVVWVANYQNLPVYNPVSTITQTFNIVIDAYCHYTIFEYIQPATLIHEIGSTFKVYNIPDIKDSVSMTMGSPVNGLAYCRARTYAYSTAFTTKVPSSPSISNGVVVWALTSASARKFTFGSSSANDYG